MSDSAALAEVSPADAGGRPHAPGPLEPPVDVADRPASGIHSGRVWSFVSTTGFTMAIVLLHLGQGVLLARPLGPEGRGQYAAAVLYMQLLLYVGLMGGLEVICAAAAKWAQSGDGDDALHQLRRASFRLSLATGSITTAVVVFLSVVAMPSDKREAIPLAVLCAFSVIGQHVVLIMTAVDRGTERFGAYNVRRFIAAAAFPALVAVAATMVNLTVPMACGLWVAASLLSMGTCLYDLPRPTSNDYEPPVGEMLHRSRPYGLSMLATDLFERLDLLLVLWLASDVQQGFYAAMVPAVYPLTVIPNTLGVFLFNAGADENRRLTVGGVHRVLGLSIAGQAVMTAVFMALIGWAVTLIYGEDYRPAVVFALWLAPASAIRGILQGLDGYLKGRGRPLACVGARVVGMISLGICVAVLYPIHGVVAVAMSVLVSQTICLLVLAGVMYADCEN